MIHELGVRPHHIYGTDEEKIKFLHGRVHEDLLEAKRFPVPPNFLTIQGDTVFPSLTAERYRELCINQSEVVVFEGIFEVYNAQREPLIISTMVVDGVIKIDAIEEINSNPDNYPDGVIEYTSEDYLKKYLTEEGFDIGKLLEDDFLAAIRLLLQNKLYTSSAKLLVVCIDSIAYLEFGDTPKNFTKWLDEYVDLSAVGIIAEELFEFRNSLLHMTNLDSRKVIDGSVGRISFYVSKDKIKHLTQNDELKYFNFIDLTRAFQKGVDKWVASFNIDRSKFEYFVERYDKIISDSRYPAVKFF